MTVTLLVPEWEAVSDARIFAGNREDPEKFPESFRGYGVTLNRALGIDVIHFNERLGALPARLQDVPMKLVSLIKHNSPLTMADDGRYLDGDIDARVETYVKDGVTQQSIKVSGGPETSLEDLNLWFDDLLSGKKADKNPSPIPRLMRVSVQAVVNDASGFRNFRVALDDAPDRIVSAVVDTLQGYFENVTTFKQ